MAKVVKRALSGKHRSLDFVFDDYSESRVTTMGNILEVVTMQKPCYGPPIRKLDNDHYVDLRSGEVFEYEHGETRADDLRSVQRTMDRIRALINTNVTVTENCRWVTFTYQENMTDANRLYNDYKKFWAKFKRWCKASGYPDPEYITVQEPQGRGAWHIHAFFIWASKAPFIPNNEVLWPMWGHGFTKIKALRDVDNIGAYFSAYLSDMPLEDIERLSPEDAARVVDGCEVVAKEFVNEQELIKEKRFVKGARLKLYPAKMNIVRYSSGIKLPTVERMLYADAKEKIGSAKPTFSTLYAVVADDGSVRNSICKSYYNKAKKD